ncbi:MAG TPA: hypothetical protein PLV42_09350 [bacterium]|nr:hypothetical protein [bacterium]
MRVLILLTMFFTAAFIQAAPAADTLSPEALAGETAAIVTECRDNEEKIAKLLKEAVNEKDIRWKLCLGDTAVTARGIAASAETARDRMNDLISAGKNDSAKAQFALLRGLAEASKKAFLEAQACRRQLTKVTDGSETKRENDTRKSGSCGNGDGVNDAMCVGFTDDMVTERPGGMKGDDPIDAAGTDQTGGSYETPGSVGEDSGAVQDHFQEILDPPFQPVSPEK